MMGIIVNFDKERELRCAGIEIPQHTKDSLNRYFINGWLPGGFCESMLAHDYERAITVADQANKQVFWDIATWIQENAPSGSAGSYSIVNDWASDKNSVRSTFAQQAQKDFCN